MILNVNSGGGEKVTIDGVKVKEKLALKCVIEDTKLPDFPVTLNFNDYTDAFVYNDEIYAFYYDYIYKYDGTSWTQVVSLPFSYNAGQAVVYKNEIHILGCASNSSYYKYHYKYNGSSWTRLNNLSINIMSSSEAVVYNNAIHIFNYLSHYKFNGSSWTKLSNLPVSFSGAKAVVYNNELHILGGAGNLNYYNSHYKYDGSSWTKLSDLPYPFYNGYAVLHDNEIHILGSSKDYDSSTNPITYPYGKNHYKYDGSSWTELSDLPYDMDRAYAVSYKNEIHVFGGYNHPTEHYIIQRMLYLREG